jgi:hypothetical protein
VGGLFGRGEECTLAGCRRLLDFNFKPISPRGDRARWPGAGGFFEFNFNFNFHCHFNLNFNCISPRASRLRATYFSQAPEK